MPNIIDYIEWRGDLGFENSSINEIDESKIEKATKMHVKSVTGKALSLSLFKLQFAAR